MIKLNSIVAYSTSKINTNQLKSNTYISTENMITNFGGVVPSNNIPKSTKVTAFKANDILLSNIRPYFRKMYFSSFDGGCSNDVLCMSLVDKSILPKYLYYAISTDNFFNYVMSTATGTKMPRGDKHAILEYKINIEDTITQQHIVDKRRSAYVY